MAISLRKFRSRLITVVAVTIILCAVVFTLFRAAIPYITDYGDTIEETLSKELGIPVQIGMVDADIYWLVPRLKLLDVNVFDKQQKHLLHFEEINVSIDWIKTIEKFRPEVGAISLVGLNLDVERNKKGNYVIQGHEIEAKTEDVATIPPEVNAFLESSSLYLVDSTIRWHDQLNNNQKINLSSVNIALVNDAPGHQLSINFNLPAMYGNKFEIIIDIEGVVSQPLSWHGNAYLGIENLRLEKWFDDYWEIIGFAGRGRLDANVWLEWDKEEVKNISTVLDVDNIALHYLEDEVRSWQLDRLSGKANWITTDEGWQTDIRDLEVSINNLAWPGRSALSINFDKNKNELLTQTTFLRIQDLAHLGGLISKFLPLDGFDWNESVGAYNPKGDLYSFTLNLPLDHYTDTQISSGFVDLSFTSNNTDIPSVSGLDGRLSFDGEGTVLALDSRNIDLDFHDLFRNHLWLDSLTGNIGFYRKEKEWLIESEIISAVTPHLETSTRLKVVLPDEKPAFMDLVSNFQNGKGAYKSLYLPTAIMPEDAVKWVDRSLVDLFIPNGGVVYYGEFSSFPFVKHDGVMQVLFDVEKATLQYMPDWPALENMNARVCFYNESMFIDKAEGSVYGAGFSNTEVTIDDLNHVHVSVDGDIKSPLFDVLKFVENSPLKETLGTYITSFGVQGQTDLDLNLQIPVEKDDDVSLKGVLTFKDNEIFLPQEKYLFKNVNGQLTFTESGVTSEAINAKLDGHPLTMSLSNVEQNKKPVIRINATGFLPVKSVLAPVPKLKEFMRGESDWEFDAYIPATFSDDSSPINLFVRSNLKGVQSSLLGPFSKSYSQSAPFKLHIGLLKDEFTTYMKYGDDFKLSTKEKANRWKVNLDSPSLKGSATFHDNFMLDELADINLDYINISAFESSDDGSKVKINPAEFPPMNIQAHSLEWKQRKFSDVNIQTRRSKQGMQIQHLELHAPEVSVMGKGTWLSSWRHEHITALEANISSRNFGQAVNQLNITKSLLNSEGTGKINWKWFAAPYEFDWQILQGEAHFHLEDGALKDIDAGTGRLLGILNFETLLSLDFGSQVSDGFSFDDMKATFSFENGNANTTNFEIESKVADINLTGRMGLKQEDYDMEIEVFPKVSNLVTTVGTATGGPVLGVAVHFFQKMFGIDKVAGHKYSVTGSWDDPQVVKLAAPEVKSTETQEESDF